MTFFFLLLDLEWAEGFNFAQVNDYLGKYGCLSKNKKPPEQ